MAEKSHFTLRFALPVKSKCMFGVYKCERDVWEPLNPKMILVKNIGNYKDFFSRSV